MNWKLFLCQWKRELWGMRPLLWIWVPLLGLHALCVLHGADWAETLRQSPLRDVIQTSSGWLVLLPTALVSLWPVRGDLPLDPDAFWRTKPIPGVLVAAAKAAAVLTAFIGSALLVDGALALWLGGLSGLDGVLLEYLLVRTAVVVAVLALIALAGGGLRLVVLMGTAGLALAVVVNILADRLLPPDALRFTPTLIASRFLVAGACVLVGSGGVLVLLYQHRRTGGAWRTALGTSLVAISVFLCWPIDLYRRDLPGAADAGPGSARIGLNPTEGGVKTTPYARRHPHFLTLRLDLTPPTPYPSSRILASSIQVRDSANQRLATGWARLQAGPQGSNTRAITDADELALAYTLSTAQGPDQPPPTLPYDVNLRVPFPRMVEGTYAARTDVACYAFRRIGTLALVDGAVLQHQGARIKITAVGWNPGNGGHLVVNIREQVLQPPFDLNGPTVGLPSGQGVSASLFGYVILDESGQVLHAQPNPGHDRFQSPGGHEGAIFSMVQHNQRQLKVWPQPGDPQGLDLVTSFQDRSLAVVQRVYVGSITAHAKAAWKGDPQ